LVNPIKEFAEFSSQFVLSIFLQRQLQKESPSVAEGLFLQSLLTIGLFEDEGISQIQLFGFTGTSKHCRHPPLQGQALAVLLSTRTIRALNIKKTILRKI